MGIVKCGVYGAKCGVWSVECRVRSHRAPLVVVLRTDVNGCGQLRTVATPKVKR